MIRKYSKIGENSVFCEGFLKISVSLWFGDMVQPFLLRFGFGSAEPKIRQFGRSLIEIETKIKITLVTTA